MRVPILRADESEGARGARTQEGKEPACDEKGKE